MQEYVWIADELIGKFAKEGARYIDVGSRLINTIETPYRNSKWLRLSCEVNSIPRGLIKDY